MSLRVRREYDRALDVGRTQCFALRRFQHKVGEPVVDQVNCQVIVTQSPFAEGQLRWRCYDSAYAKSLEQALKQNELWIEILLLRGLVYNRDSSKRPVIH